MGCVTKCILCFALVCNHRVEEKTQTPTATTHDCALSTSLRQYINHIDMDHLAYVLSKQYKAVYNELKELEYYTYSLEQELFMMRITNYHTRNSGILMGSFVLCVLLLVYFVCIVGI